VASFHISVFKTVRNYRFNKNLHTRGPRRGLLSNEGYWFEVEERDCIDAGERIYSCTVAFRRTGVFDPISRVGDILYRLRRRQRWATERGRTTGVSATCSPGTILSSSLAYAAATSAAYRCQRLFLWVSV
jgi:hypothetical protein